MINWRFFKVQFKSISLIVLLIALAFSCLIAFGLMFDAFYSYTIDIDNGKEKNGNGASILLQTVVFGGAGKTLFFLLGLMIIGKIVLRENERGYVGSWLTTPVSRWAIFNTKLSIVIFSQLLLFFWIFLLQCVLYGIFFHDFSLYVGHLLLANLNLLLSGLLMSSIIWIIGSLINKPGIVLAISSGIYSWFIFASFILAPMGESPLPSLAWMKYFKYLSIFSLFNSPFMLWGGYGYHQNWEEILKAGPLNSLKAIDFAWQLPLAAIMSAGLFAGTQFIYKNKDFSI